ncbi:MAG: SDR family NAD(P)-dependent oxidoreductase [Pseudomonadota bacterium]
MTHILITGAASGIGRAAALKLAAEGTRLTLIDRDASGLDTLLSEHSGGDWQAVPMDVSDPDAWAALDLGDAPLTGGVIAAGISDAAPITELSFSDWRRVLSINLDGAFLALQAVLRHAGEGASIVAVSSATGKKAVPNTAAYGASKAALSQIVKVAALEAAPRQIRVNAIAPGGVKTPMFSNLGFFKELTALHGDEDAAWSAMAVETPLKRFSEPEEMAALIAFLLGPDAASITGAVLDCDGGYSV